MREWLHGRGFTDELIAANHIGADPGRRMMPRRRGLPYGNSVAAVFPALDPTVSIQYLQARYLEPGDGPKYDNPSGVLGTNPRLAWARPVEHNRSDVLIVCEGIPDALTAAGDGFRATAVLGSQAPDRSVANRLGTFADRQGFDLVAVVDNDEAGHAWGARLSHLLEDTGRDLVVLEPPVPGMDLNAWATLDPDWGRSLGLSSSPPERVCEEPLGIADR